MHDGRIASQVLRPEGWASPAPDSRLDRHGIHGLPRWGADRLDRARLGSGGT